jgi:hypothetical protein
MRRRAEAAWATTRRLAGWVAPRAPAAVVVALVVAACSQGSGSGTACGTLDVVNCWNGSFNLQPNFFAAVTAQPTDALQIRIQNGGDYESFSDGINILVDSIGAISPALLGKTISVSLPPGVTPPGVPLTANGNPSHVHAVLYLQKSCRTQDIALYAMDAVSLSANGGCGAADTGEPPNACPLLTHSSAGAALDAGDAGDAGGLPDASLTSDAGLSPDGGAAAAPGAVVGSTIVFDKIFDGDPNESNAASRLTDVPQFDLYFADPREVAPGGLGPPPPCRAHLVGNFKFYFERGQPSQPFQ